MRHNIRYSLLRSVAYFRKRGKASGLSRGMRSVNAVVGPGLAIIQYVAAIACLVCMLLFVGFSPDEMDRRIIMKIVRASQIVFLAGILYDFIFDFKNTNSARKLLRRLTDILIILSVIPLLGVSVAELHFLQTRSFLFLCLGIYSVGELCYGTMRLLGKRTNPSLILSGSFMVFILIGSFVLMLPKCTVGEHLRYVDSFFMAASAVSMTGLSTIDAAEVFTPLGWSVIAVLMQIGALGVLTFTSFFALFFTGRPSIYNQILMRDFVYSKNMSALVPVIFYILSFTLVIELIGAVGLYYTLPIGFGESWEQRAFFSVFHSMSAFCNCGFTTLPDGVANPLFIGGSQMFYIVMMILILAGGIGFPNLVNLREVFLEYFKRLKCFATGHHYIKKAHIYDLNTKLVLIFSLIMFLGGAATFYVMEFNHAFENLPLGRKVIQSFFCSATIRTAGFITYGPETWLGPTFVVAVFLMWIGCASQSMGGGIKINAFAAVLLNLRSIVFGQKGVVIFGRSISLDSIRRANAVVIFFIFALVFYACVIMVIEPELPALSVFFECFSALSTVGISAGITPHLGDLAKIILASAMFLGRVGIISVLCGVIGDRKDNSVMLPEDDIIIN